MEKVPFQVEINVSQVPNRFCRPFQEQICDYYSQGRARYEWDKIRQEHILNGDTTILDICGPCPLNILLEVEGCKGDLYEFEIFLKALSIIKPDSLLFQKNILNASFSEEETRQLLAELEEVQQLGNSIGWPVAQVFMPGGIPAVSENSIKFNNMVYYEWTGEDMENFFTTNRGYHIGISREGIVLKKNFGENLPDFFQSLTRKGFRVLGQTVSGTSVPIPLNRTKLPEWFPDNPEMDSELRFTEVPISNVFHDVFNMIFVYGNMAVNNFTGINIFSEFYRRA